MRAFGRSPRRGVALRDWRGASPRGRRRPSLRARSQRARIRRRARRPAARPARQRSATRASATAAPCSAIAASSDGEPGLVPAFLGEQLVARAHRRFVARRMVRVARLERQHQPVEEAPPLARAAGEQPVHRRRQPQHRQPFGQAVHRGRRAVDPHLPPFGRSRRASRCRCRSSPSRAATAQPPLPPCRAISRQRSAAQPAPGRQHRHRLEQVGLARAILAEQQDEAGPRLEHRRGVGAEVGQGEAADGHERRA